MVACFFVDYYFCGRAKYICENIQGRRYSTLGILTMLNKEPSIVIAMFKSEQSNSLEISSVKKK